MRRPDEALAYLARWAAEDDPTYHTTRSTAQSVLAYVSDIEARVRSLTEALEAVRKLPTRWRCFSLESPEDAPRVRVGSECANELESALAETAE